VREVGEQEAVLQLIKGETLDRHLIELIAHGTEEILIPALSWGMPC
jgi:hypothetical protein